MYFLNTEMTWIVFVITLIEVIALFIQLVYCLQRPSDKSRLWYLILLYLLIQYNIASGLFPDPSIAISITIQNIIAYSSGILMSMYFCVYFYLAFDLNHLRFFALYGAFLFILAPFLLIFVGGYLYTGDLDSSRKFLVIIPFLYGVGWLYNVGRAFHIKYFQKSAHFRHPLYKESVIAVYLALIFWMSLPVVVYFGGGQILEQTMTNIGFLIMTISYIRIQVKKSNAEYRMQMLSSGELDALDNIHSKFKEEAAIKNTEMLRQAMVLLRNKDFIQQITNKINEIHHTEREIFKPITKAIDEERCLEEELESFYKIFDHENDDFHKKLAEKHPDLTLSEKRHLSYIKLNMSNQEIVSPKRS